MALARVAWAQTISGVFLIHPSCWSSLKPRAIAMKVSPTATGATTTSGGVNPLCSQIS